MSTLKILLTLFAFSIFISSCELTDFDNTDLTPLVEPETCETAIAGIENDSGEPVMAKLSRYRKWVKASFDADNLKADHTYYVWWVIYNNPSLCTTPNECGSPDLDQSDVVGIELIQKDSIVTNSNGEVSYQGALISFNNSKSMNEKMGMESNRGLTNVKGAEIHLLIKENNFDPDTNVDDHESNCTQNCDIYFLPVPRTQYAEAGCNEVMYGTFTDCNQ